MCITRPKPITPFPSKRGRGGSLGEAASSSRAALLPCHANFFKSGTNRPALNAKPTHNCEAVAPGGEEGEEAAGFLLTRAPSLSMPRKPAACHAGTASRGRSTRRAGRAASRSHAAAPRSGPPVVRQTDHESNSSSSILASEKGDELPLDLGLGVTRARPAL